MRMNSFSVKEDLNFVHGFSKTFDNWSDGFVELTEVSFSVWDAVNFSLGLRQYEDASNLSESEVLSSLISNIYWNNQSSLDNAQRDILILPGVISYLTGGGLRFGWEILIDNNTNNSFKFFVIHKEATSSTAGPKLSTLRQSCEESGWVEGQIHENILPVKY